ncbi:hypothetical protein [Jiella marina]|uniref:hypothetical protein n=1 Tax=Jiella sp. LLJ827 TaxID=2917712 RepID=UPI002101C6B5|nr:hypothetical protein [Jiella sp. LLJ827]MCQ0987601.1 hypothetical protein [Jiella sp. LLJ827]
MDADPDLLAQLRRVRLPPGFDTLDWHGGLAIFSLAVLGGLLIVLLVYAVTEPRRSPRREAETALRRAASLSPGERLLHQARVVAGLQGTLTSSRHAPLNDRLAVIKTEIETALYRPHPAVDCEAMDAAILSALSRQRG